MGLQLADIIVLVVYLLGITALGVWMSRSVKNMSEFFMPRKFGKAMMITNAFGTGTGSDQAVSVAAATFSSGLSGIWWQWIWLPATPFYWLIAPIMRRLRAITTADVYRLRYNESVAVLFAVVGIVGLSVKIGVMLEGAGAMVQASTGGAVGAQTAILVITVMFVAYGTAGGLSAAIVTDFVQGILTILLSIMLLPFVLNAVGGLSGIRETVDAEKLSLVVPGKIGPFFVVMYSIQALIGIVAQPFIMGVCASGRTEMDGRVGFMVGNIVKRFCTMAWCVTALAGVAWYIQQGTDLASVKADHVYGDLARAFLPNILPGLLGVFLASLLAAVMSSCDAYMISSAGLFTKNIYKPMVSGKRDAHYLKVGRITALVVTAGGIAFTYWSDDILQALNVWFRIAPMMGIAFWMGLFWRRATPAGAWAATLTGFGVWWATTQQWFIDWAASWPALPWLRVTWQDGDKLQLYEPMVILLYTIAAIAVGVVVSLLTRPVDKEQLDRFYTLTRTPIVPGEVIEEPCQLPAGVAPAERRMITTAYGLEIPMPSATSFIGFAAGWLAVAALVGGFVWIIR